MTELIGSGITWGDDWIIAEPFTDRVLTKVVVTPEGWEAESDVTEEWTRGRVCDWWEASFRYDRLQWMLRFPVLRRWVGREPRTPASLTILGMGGAIEDPIRFVGANVHLTDAVVLPTAKNA